MRLVGDVGADAGREDEVRELVLPGDPTVIDLVLHRVPNGAVQAEDDLDPRQLVRVLHGPAEAHATVVDDENFVLGEIGELQQLGPEVFQVRSLCERPQQHVLAGSPCPDRAVALSGGRAGHHEPRDPGVSGLGQVVGDLLLVRVLERELLGVELYADCAAGPRGGTVSDLVVRPRLAQQLLRHLAGESQYLAALGVGVGQDGLEGHPRRAADVLLADDQLAFQLGEAGLVALAGAVHEDVRAPLDDDPRGHLLLGVAHRNSLLWASEEPPLGGSDGPPHSA